MTNLYFAPMEGITGHLYRTAHARVFGGADRYYAPFIYANPDGHIGGRDAEDLAPENNADITLVPQILSNNADAFLATAAALKSLGYEEVNLNLGCPSKKVSGRGRGSGFLARPDELAVFLDKVYAHTPLAVSVKTRIGVSDEGEFEKLLEIFSRFPIAELTIHPRLRDDYYTGPLHTEAWEQAAGVLKMPLCYNGDLNTCADFIHCMERTYAPEAAMIGRGALANPALFRMIRGGAPAAVREIKQLHDLLYAGYQSRISSERKVLAILKEQWQFWRYLMSPEDQKTVEQILRTRLFCDYERLTDDLFSTCNLLHESRYGQKKGAC